MVLPNATITTVTAQSDPDLFKALKGGGNLYGIVTTYVLEAHPIGQVSVFRPMTCNADDSGLGRQLHLFQQ